MRTALNDVFSPEQTLDLLRKKALEAGDSFRVKVFRKRPGVIGPGLAETVATLDEASIAHIANPEEWLPRLCGGGPVYQLSIYHTLDQTLPLGSPINYTIQGDPRPIDANSLNAMRSPDWHGPKVLVYPSERDIAPAGGPSLYAVPPPFHMSPSAPQSLERSGMGGGTVSNHVEELRLAARERELEQTRQHLESERRKLEVETIRRESEQRLRDIEARFVQSAVSPKPSGDLKELVVALGPVIAQFMQSQHEMRMVLMKADQDRAAQTQQMMQLLMNRPPIDPTVQAMIEKGRTGVESNTQMISHMTEAMGTMTRTTMELVNAAIDAGLGGKSPEEPTGLKIVREAVKAMAAFSQGYQASILQKAIEKGQAIPVPVHPGFAQQALGQPHSTIPGQPEVRGLLDVLEVNIKAKAPPAQVAAAFIDGLKRGEPSLIRELKAVDGDTTELFSRRLGGWVMADTAHVEYTKQLFAEVQHQGMAAGVLAADEEDRGAVDDETSKESSHSVDEGAIAPD